MRSASWLTHLGPDGFRQLSQVLRRGLLLVRVRRMSINLRVRRMLAYMVQRHARGGRGLLVLGHGGVLRPRRLQCGPHYTSRGADGTVAGEPEKTALGGSIT
jgi:hypothetical protein